MIKAVMTLLLACFLSSTVYAAEFWQFGVYLGDKRIGEHRFELYRDGHVERVTSIAKMKAKLLFVPVYTYDHTAEEEWAGGCLRSIRSSSRANGNQFAVTAENDDAGLVINVEINGKPATQIVNGCIHTYAYWDRQRLDDANALLNPQTGELEPAELLDLGEDRRLITSDASIDLRYSSDGHWLGLELMTPIGKPLTYRLEDSHRTLASLTSRR
jgi:hypothetical protein